VNVDPELGPDVEAAPAAPLPEEPERPEETVVATASARRSLTRQRPLAAIVVVSAILVVIGLTAGPWARTTTPGDDESGFHIDLDARGGVDVSDEPVELVRRYEDAANAQQRAVLEASVHGSSADLALVLAVLFAVVAAVALLRDLTPHSWVLVAATAIGCLVTAMLQRDDVIAALATSTVAMDLGPTETSPTFWSGLTVGAAAAAGLAAVFAAAPRPVEPFVPLDTETGDAARAEGTGRRGRRRLGWKSRAARNTF
jgi:hypothetical protein